MNRGCGVLLPVSSLPNEYGFGCFSIEAYEFVDYLSKLGMKYWQILPLGIVDDYGSPYSSVSAFAGEPLYIDIEKVLSKEEINFFKLSKDLSFLEYRKRKTEALKYCFSKLYYSINLDKFTEENEDWIYDYAVYMALKDKLGVGFTKFPEQYKNNNSPETIEFIKSHSEEIVYYIFLQYLFSTQWKELKDYANKKGILIIGDVPIYCSMDSVDMYAKKKNFLLDEKFVPTYVAGVPGDYFNPEGQLWGNPLYDYDYMKKNNYDWWIKRLKFLNDWYDYIRIDHFRGFESFFAVPYKDKFIKYGAWMKGPGMDIFKAFYANKIKNLFLEDLGVITYAVKALKNRTGLAGMKVVQFAFDDPQNDTHMPHTFNKNCVAYLGTHDNDTFVGFLNSSDKKGKFCEYYGVSENTDSKLITKIAIENLLSTEANVCILTMQDILQEGSESRINTPGTAEGNWVYKLDPNYKENEFNKYLKTLIKIKNR